MSEREAIKEKLRMEIIHAIIICVIDASILYLLSLMV